MRSLEELSKERDEEDKTRSNIQRQINEVNSLISDNLMKKNLIETKRSEYQSCQNLLNQVEQERAGKIAPEEVRLPDTFMEQMTNVESGILAWNTYENLISDKMRAEESIAKCQKELNNLSNISSELQRYIKITGPTGKIYEEIMTRLADQFSDNQVEYEVITYNFRKKDHLDLASKFKNNGNKIAYQACSSGQKTVLDVNFLSKIATRLGILVMDEFLKHLDPANHEICVDLIKSMNIGCTMLSSHMESIAAFNNKSCHLELNDSGVTKINLL